VAALGEVRTDRLLLRPWSADDLDALAAVFARPEVWWYPLRRGRDRAETAGFLDRQLAAWADRGWGLWAAERTSDARLVGYVGLAPPDFLPEVMPAVEVGWRLDPDCWGQGLATEGGRAALRAGFDDLGLEEIVSICEPENVASSRVMQRLGMRLVRATRHPERGEPLHVYAIDRERWSAAG